MKMSNNATEVYNEEKRSSKNGSVKVLIPQVIATFIISLTHVSLMGFCMGYSAVFITQMEECQNGIQNCTDIITITDTDKSWIASIFPIFIPVGAVIGSTIMDATGRKVLLILSVVPGVIGWTVIALANSSTLIIVGRIIGGIAGAWTTCAAAVYVSEITSPKIRGSMGGVPTLNVSAGITLVYVMGYFLHWRIIAWFCVAFSVVSGILTFLLPKSPEWLVNKGKIEDAEKSLNWLNRYHPDSKVVTKTQLENMIKLNVIQKKENGSTSNDIKAKLKMFLDPTVYKPMLILPFLNILVQFSGVYVVIYYATTFFQAAGTNINPYIAAMCFGGARLIASIFAIGLLRHFGRRPLMIVSGLGMTVTMAVSGLFTKWIQEGTSTQMWVPLVMIALYVIATMIGYLIIPLSIPAEMFPTAVRGMAQSISMGILFGLSFLSIFSYYELNNLLGGLPGVQFFYAGMSFIGVVYTYVFLLETYKKKLHEIGEFYKHHTIYLFYLLRSKNITESRENII